MCHLCTLNQTSEIELWFPTGLDAVMLQAKAQVSAASEADGKEIQGCGARRAPETWNSPPRGGATIELTYCMQE